MKIQTCSQKEIRINFSLTAMCYAASSESESEKEYIWFCLFPFNKIGDSKPKREWNSKHYGMYGIEPRYLCATKEEWLLGLN